MKRFYIIAILIISGMTAMAQNRPDITHQTTGDDRRGIVSFTDMLQLQFNDEGMIEVIGCGSNYYRVNVTQGTANVWSETIGREKGNVINYDFPEIGTFLITLTNSRGSTTLWRLENGVINGSSRIPNWGEVATKNDYGQTSDQ